ncbi:dethiobiotin synthase [Williamsia sp. R60]
MNLVITGTSTEVGKTITTAALAAAVMARGLHVAVCKPAQTGVGPDDPGDIDEVVRLAGVRTTAEGARFRDPLAPERAARNEGAQPVLLSDVVAAVDGLAGSDLVLVEGAGGVLVRLAPDLTILDVADAIGARVLVVAAPGLGSLNHTELTVRAITGAGLECAGVVIGSWPVDPDLAERCNLEDLPQVTGVPIVGKVPAGAGTLDRQAFVSQAVGWFDREWLTAMCPTPN